MLFPQNDSCRLSPFFYPYLLTYHCQNFWYKSCVGIFGETEGGKAVLEGSEAEWDGWKGRKRRVARLALSGDVTRMKTMIIGGAGASPCRLR